jgi:TolB-like protein/lipoprotein NlpI
VPQAIFLSYASQDAEVARRLCEALRAQGLEVWFDQSELRGGDAWDASIRKQIKECALFIPIISSNTDARIEGYFRLEWKLAVDRSHLMADDATFFVPVILDACEEVTARVPEKFRERQWSRIASDEAMQSFAARVAKLVNVEQGGAVSGNSALSSPPVLGNDDVESGVLKPRNASPFVVSPSNHTSASPASRDTSMSFDKLRTNGDLRAADAIPAVPSIAVLAFANRSASADDEYFSDGLADELLNVLAKIKGLRVAARTSAFQFKGKNTDIAEIGARLNVAHVLEGSVRKSGNRVRVAVQLVKTADGYHLWSESYDRTLDDIFEVQDDIAQSVVKELQATLLVTSQAQDSSAAVKAANVGRTENAEAYQLWMLGRQRMKGPSAEYREKAIEYYRRATELDPTFAVAWADMGTALYYAAANNAGTQNYVDGYKSGKAAAMRALSIDANTAEAHVALASILSILDWDGHGAQAAVAHALALAPGNAEVLSQCAIHRMRWRQFDDALDLSNRALELDPLNPLAHAVLGRTHYYQGHPAHAERALHRSLEIGTTRWARDNLFRVLLEQGRLDEAASANAAEPFDWTRLQWKCCLLWSQARREEALAHRDELAAKYAHFMAWQIAEVSAWFGDADGVFKWIDEAYRLHDAGVLWVNADPWFAQFQTDPRWLPTMRKLGFVR